ncbi:MAG: hypothetical protein GWO24_11160, partial [Akkermansiaceae bacterium]|nr:hypothetical protein [Akkermansiaceae bacterium]
EISDGIIVQPQREKWWGWKVALKTANHRPVDLRLELAGGDFWNGTLLLWRGELGLRPSKHLTVNVFYEEFDINISEG